MARKIRVQVQVDRLPDIVDEAGKPSVQLGLRVSAAIDPNNSAADAAQTGDEKLILPWKWLDKGTAKSWNPHDAKSWMVFFRKADGSFVNVSGDLRVLTKIESGVEKNDGTALFDPKDRFRNRVEKEVLSILETSGIRAAAEVPGPSGVVTGRTLFGFAESLTALPNPIPAAMKVWTAAWVTKEKLLASGFEDEFPFVAVPVFAVADASYEPDGDFKATTVNRQWTAGFKAGGGAVEADGLVFASLPPSEMRIPNTSPERLINLADLSIRAKEAAQFEGSDWIATIGSRIAEAIDPAARAMSVLEEAILGAVQSDDAKRIALKGDANNRFGRALAELHRPIVAPRARRSDAATAPAASFFEAMAVRTPQLWPSIVPILYAQAGDDERLAAPAFEAASRERLLAAAGVPPSPELAPAAPPADRTPLLDSEADFVDWLVKHWLAFPERRDLAKGESRAFAGTSRSLVRGTTSVKTEEKIVPTGVIDFTRAARGSADTVLAIPIRLVPVAGQVYPCKTTIVFDTAESARTGTEIRVEITFRDADTHVEVVGVGSVDTSALPKTGARLSLEVTLPPSGDEKLAVVYENKTIAIADLAVIRGGRVRATVTTEELISVGIDGAAVLKPSIDRERLRGQAHTLRTALSSVWAGSIVPGILQGWAPVAGELVEPVQDLPLADRISKAVGKFADDWFDDAFEAAAVAAGFPPKDTSALRLLLDAVRIAAVDDAKRLAESIVPAVLDDHADARITEDALPLAFLISQLQDFDEDDDLWGRLAGVGVLISRDKDMTDKRHWWSLNAATLHVTDDKPVAERAPLLETNAVATGVEEGGTDAWKKASKVDPVPLSVADVSGARSALVKYENHSIVGELEGAPQLDPAGTAATVRRRPEAFLFPTRNFTRMPALTFGRTYGILPYLIAHGGVVPVELREKPWNPVILKKLEADDARVIDPAKFEPPGDHYLHVRSTRYPRTVPVGAPRIAEAQWPGMFPGVDALADELPLRPPPITLQKDVESRFFVDKERLSGVLSARGEMILIEIAEIDLTAPDATLSLRVDRRGDDPALEIEVKISELVAAATKKDHLGLRIEVSDMATGPRLFVLERREDLHADDLPKATALQTAFTPKLRLDAAKWDRVSLVATSTDKAFTIEPPSIRWASKDANGKFSLHGDRPTFPPELAHAARKVSVLDGIKTGAKTGATKLELSLRRPSTSLSTYERWINGPTGGIGSATPADIVKTIDRARNDRTTLRREDRSIDDPAVEAIFIEVVQLFPRRVPRSLKDAANKVIDGPALARTLAGNFEAVTNLNGGVLSKVEVSIGGDPLATGEVGTVSADGKVALTFAPGGIYEIRVWAGVPKEQKLFWDGVTADRFSAAVRAHWREAGDWHLGTPLALTVEVATEAMPDCWPRKVNGAFDYEKPLFALEVARPPAVVEDRARVRLVPEHALLPIDSPTSDAVLRRYAALRYANRAALLHQRWSWRGRPHPEAALEEKNPSWGTHADMISKSLGSFVNAAFLGRADDDIGAIREVTFGRAHAAGGEEQMALGTTTKRPVLMEHDLDRRAGAHLWRFALRLKSRYAAMRPNHPDLLRFSHQQIDQNEDSADNVPPGTKWWRVVVPDHIQSRGMPRRIDRPSLMLVLPLTESTMTGGSVPPLLAVFNQELFPQFNAADGIETVIDVARHPFPGVERLQEAGGDETALVNAWDAVVAERRDFDAAERQYAASFALRSDAVEGDQLTNLAVRNKALEDVRKAEAGVVALLPPPRVSGRAVNPFTKYFQELAPDPIREATAGVDRPVAVRVDGPIGYTFDAGTEAGLFQHAALLVSPVAETLRPRSFVKLRFRRFETPRLLVSGSDEKPLTLEAEIPASVSRFLIECGNPELAAIDGVHHFKTVYEGLAFDVPSLGTPVDVRFRFVDPAKPGEPCSSDKEGTKVHARVEEWNDVRTLVVWAETRLGKSSTWSLPLGSGAEASLQIVVSMRPKPTESGRPAKEFKPVGDVSVRVRNTPTVESELRRPQENAWLSVLCMPLTTTTTFKDLVAVQVCPDASMSVAVTPLRLSDFAPSVWCQFAPSMSHFEVHAKTNLRSIVDVLPVGDLTATLDVAKQTFAFGLNELRDGEELEDEAPFWLRSVPLPDDAPKDALSDDAQLEEPVYAVMTRFVYDAFDRLRERVIGIHSLAVPPDASGDFGPLVWSGDNPTPYEKGMSGRIRFLRVTRGKRKRDGGFETESKVFPTHFFQKEADDGPDAEAPDAPGMVVGISSPIEWRSGA